MAAAAPEVAGLSEQLTNVKNETELLQLEHIGRDLAALAQVIPKRPLVLFFGRPTFSDNTKYLYLEALRSERDFDVMWMASTKPLADQLTAHGLPCINFLASPVEALRLMLQATVAVFSENMNAVFVGNNLFAGALAGAQKIQLWHGVSVKQLDLMLVPHLDIHDRGFRNAIKLATRTELFLSTSRRLDAFWAEAFGCGRLVRAGQPRNAVIVKEPDEYDMIGAALPPEQHAVMHDPTVKRLLVVPTWQRGAPLFTSSSVFHARLARWAERENAVVFVKEHPFRFGTEVPPHIPGRLYFLDAGVDLYPWLSRFDALITDYSSIMFDFLHTNRPIFTFDALTEVAYGFEPDWSLVPDIPFRYPFAADTLEAVLDANLATHPLRASQREMCGALFETDPATACAELLRVVGACNDDALQCDVNVIHPGDLAS